MAVAGRNTLKRALEEWQEKNGKNPAEEADINLTFRNPPLDRIDSVTLSTLTNCRYLRLSTNAITAMVPITGLKYLETLSLGRNQIKKIIGLDEVGATLKNLWLSYNNIDSLSSLSCCVVLQHFYIAHNKIKDWAELDKLKDLKTLQFCVFLGNEIYDKAGSDTEARLAVIRKLPQLTSLDGKSTFEELTKIKLEEQQDA